jgi:anti-anti-sigma factor
VVVDLSATTFLDSTGLGFLVRLDRQVGLRGHMITVVGARPSIVRVLEISGLDQIFPVLAAERSAG